MFEIIAFLIIIGILETATHGGFSHFLIASGNALIGLGCGLMLLWITLVIIFGGLALF